jgi:hypothetical protein
MANSVIKTNSLVPASLLQEIRQNKKHSLQEASKHLLISDSSVRERELGVKPKKIDIDAFISYYGFSPEMVEWRESQFLSSIKAKKRFELVRKLKKIAIKFAPDKHVKTNGLVPAADVFKELWPLVEDCKSAGLF